jgi:hypothetical protein
MASIGELQVAEFLGNAKHASGGSDASNKGNREVHALTVTRERTEEQVSHTHPTPPLLPFSCSPLGLPLPFPNPSSHTLEHCR